MPAQVDHLLRTRLEERGLWIAFREWRRDLKQRLGMEPKAARETANRIFRRVLAGEVDVATLRDANGLPVVPGEEARPAPTAPKDAMAALRGKKPVRPSVGFRWVLRNLREAEPDAATCPDLESWNTLQLCRENAAMMQQLTVEFYRRGFSRDEGDDRANEAIDGQDEIDVLDRLLGPEGGEG